MRISPRVVVGLLIVAFGLALTLDELGVMEAGELIHYWPFGILAVGIANVLEKDRSKRTFGWILTGVGALLVTENVFHFNVDVWRFWPLAIVVFVLGLLLAIPSVIAHRTNPNEVRVGAVSNMEAMQKAKEPIWVPFTFPIIGVVGVLVGSRLRRKP